ncbi:hypothetical protein [Streptomyces sp. NPDC049879]|uniref:hypothetical protein n=1 Tax=Streptomyces sp. NPDC049879 TaxID=3365598 RepID=UPI0037BC19BB
MPESAEVRAHKARAPRSVISSMAELEALARMRGCRPADGGNFRTSKEVRDVARTLDQNVVDDGLAVLASAGLPFWVAPEVWVLLNRGWSPDRVAAELDGVDTAKSPHSAARYRLAKAAERPDAEDGPLDAVPAQGGSVDAPAPAPAADGPPLGLDDLVKRDANHNIPAWGEAGCDVDPADPADVDPGAAPWDRAAAERTRKSFGWRAPAVPQYDDMDAVRARQAEVRAEAGAEMTPGYGRRMLDLIKTGRGGDWSALNQALGHP